MPVKLIDANTQGYDRWCEAAQRAHPAEWSSATQETREPWIVEARQKEIDAEEARVSRTRGSAAKFDKMKPGINPPVVGEPGVPADGLGRPKPGKG
jgi:hypothetical protein